MDDGIPTCQDLGGSELSNSEDRFRTIFEHAPMGMAELEGGMARLVRANERLGMMLGRSSADLQGQAIAQFVVPEYRDALTADIALARKGETVPPRAVRVLRADGAVVWGGVTLSCLHGPNNGLILVVEDLTRKREAEASAEAAEHRWAASIQTSPLATLVSTIDTAEILDVNPAFERLYGWTREEAIGKNGFALQLWAEPARRDDLVRQVHEHGQGHIERARIRRTNGEERIVSGNAALVTVRGQACLMSIIEDVTETALREEQLRRQEEAIRSAFDKAPVGIAFAIPAEARWVAVNQRLCNLLGYTQAELLSRSILELTHPDDRERDREMMGKLGRGLITEKRFEKRFVRKDGSIAECDAHVVVSPSAPGSPVRGVIAIEDITARRRAERELALSETRYRDLVDQLEEPILVTDLGGTVLFANRAFSRFGYDPEALQGTSAELLLPATDARAVSRKECTLTDSAGRPHPIRLRPRPVVRDGVVVGRTCIITDLTAQRETEEQLRAAQRMEAVGRLAGGIAHDFNNLLTVILSYAELTQSELPGESPLHSCLDEVMMAGKRAEGLTRQLLAFSRRQLMVLEALSVEDTVHGVGSMLRRLIGEDVSLEISLSSGLPLVMADRGQLEQVLMNLAINSRDAMADGGKITIAARPREVDETAAETLQLVPGSYVELSVADNGTGMSEETRARIFEPFFTTKEVGKGTGLGLSTVYGIVQQFGGCITVESELGSGTTFRVFLPKSSVVSESPAAARGAGPVRTSHGNECVLVVEDESAVRRVLHRLVAKAGYRAIITSSPEEALEACKKHGPAIDLVLTDVIMPGMNGRELARRIDEVLPGVRVVFMSGYTDEAIERYGVLHGRFLRKPFELAELRRVLRETLDAD